MRGPQPGGLLTPLSPQRSDPQLLAQFYHADEELSQVAAELDSLDGRKDPQRCTLLVSQFRSCQVRGGRAEGLEGSPAGGAELVRRGGLTGPLQGNGGTEDQRRRGWACGGLPQSWRVATSPMHGPDHPAGNSCGPAITASLAKQLLSSDSGLGHSPSSRAFSARQPVPLHSGRWGLGCASEITGWVGSRQGFQAPGF